MSANERETQRLPFHAGTEAFAAISHEEATARILFLTEQGWPAGWLVGPAGCGKTTILKDVRARLRAGRGEAIYLSLCGVSSSEFWTELALALGSRVRESGMNARKTIRGLLAASAMINRRVTFLLDDADRGEDTLWDDIAGLVRIVEGSRSGHTVVIATSGAVPGGDLANRIDLRAEVAPFTMEETSRYLSMRLAEAESGMEFLPDAAAELYQITGGVPALINRVADLALVTAQAGEMSRVDVESVRSASQELRPCDDAAIVTFSVENAARRQSA